MICDEKNVTASDYALCIKFIPNKLGNLDYDDEIRKVLNEYGYDIVKINLAYDLSELEKIQGELDRLCSKKIKCSNEIIEMNKKKIKQKPD